MSKKPAAAKVSLRQVRQAVSVAIGNERITRARVDALEESLLQVSQKARDELTALEARIAALEGHGVATPHA